MKPQLELCLFFEEVVYRWKFNSWIKNEAPGHRYIRINAIDYFEPAKTIFYGGEREQRW